jgi:hypothetical protein
MSPRGGPCTRYSLQCAAQGKSPLSRTGKRRYRSRCAVSKDGMKRSSGEHSGSSHLVLILCEVHIVAVGGADDRDLALELWQHTVVDCAAIQTQTATPAARQLQPRQACPSILGTTHTTGEHTRPTTVVKKSE